MATALFDRATNIASELEQATIADAAALELFRIRYLGSKNIIKDLFAEMKLVPNERKKEFGQVVNALKQQAEEKYEIFKQALSLSDTGTKQQSQDLTMPGFPVPLGSRHPVSVIRKKVIDIFGRIGFQVAEGPEIEDEWHNFTALNIPEDHPARDMTDSFYIEMPGVILRSQTSNVQIRVMETQKPPIRIIAPGRVYRNETITYKHHVFFHQLEGLYVDKNVSFADLKQTMYYFFKEFFGDAFEWRFRPSFFPFTEVSAELDIRKKGTTQWMEILGCGMVHPKVLENCNIDPEVYSGYAWGMGIERLVLLKYGIPDIRLLTENDVRFLEQFEAAW
ncbi:MAG: phenylalanine--tRNA ligase subunit alpha [Chitinophagales bacterium]|nr:phenylalanine--tRNA ligase subunit alpha [Chitinophagaceae bacterium]MBP9884344.1 phenylalanine--tRNA ligase subunit alpha [Chitinophagales bacterium]